MADRLKEIKYRSPRVTWRKISRMWPWLVWVGMLLLVIYLFKNDVDFKRMNGFVSMDIELIAPVEAGRAVERIAGCSAPEWPRRGLVETGRGTV